MRVEVRPLSVQGVPLYTSQHKRLPAIVGKLRIAENRLHRLGRVVLCASLTSTSDGLDTELLPELTDAQVIWAEDGFMRIRGVEQVNGVQYAQTWNLKVL